MFKLSGCAASTTLRDCLTRAWAVHAVCACGHRRRMFDELRALPLDATLGDLGARLRCNACGGRDGRLATLNANAHGGSA
jgi:hypothetical protein